MPPTTVLPVTRRALTTRMRDGVRLAADLYLPAGEGPWPVILVRTPYGKHIFDEVTQPGASFFAAHDFAVLVQDKRGKFASEGEYRYCSNDGADGWDTAEWLVRQPFCDGRIGTYGSSYLGDTQLALGRLRHPAVRCMVPHAASLLGSLAGRYTLGDTRAGGAFYLATYVRWFYERGARRHDRALASLDLDAACGILPLADLMERINGPPCDWREVVMAADGDSPWWLGCDLIGKEDRFDIPALHVNSWFDVGLEDTITLYDHMRLTSPSRLARDNQFLIISPAAHCGSELFTGEDRVGDLELGDARLPFEQIYLDWFEHWLRSRPRALGSWPRVRYFMLGANEWRSSDSWPPAGTRPLDLYLSPGASQGRGTLEASPASQPGSCEFVHDPADPVPTVGGAHPSAYLKIEPLDQRAIEGRDDLLIYTSPPVERELSLAGPVEAVLHISCDRPDADIVCRLIKVHVDQSAVDLRDGALRLRYRNSRVEPEPMRPGQIYEVRISLQAIAASFVPGERIRLHVAGASFPRYDRNLCTGGDNVTETQGVPARITVHHGPGRGSRLRLRAFPPDELFDTARNDRHRHAWPWPSASATGPTGAVGRRRK